MSEITPCAESDIMVGHYLGGWFIINKARLYSLATLFENVLVSEPGIKKLLVPENIDLDVFVALKGLFHGDELDIPKTDIVLVISQLESIGIKVRKLYDSVTAIADDQPMIIVKRLTKVWRATILWPRDKSVRAKNPKIKPFYNSFHSADEPVEMMELHEKDDLRECISHYKIHHYHGDFQKYIYCIGPNGSFRVNRQVIQELSALKYKVFNSFAGDMNFIFFPAQISTQTFRKFALLMLNGKSKVPKNQFKDFVSQMALAGISVGVNLGYDSTSQFRIVANPSKKSQKMICKLNKNFKLDPSECKEEPVVEIIRLAMNDVKNDAEKCRDSQSEGQEPPNKKKR